MFHLEETETFSYQELCDHLHPILFSWHQENHVKNWWDPPKTVDQMREHYSKDKKKDCFFPFIVFSNNNPFAYIQAYNAKKVGDGWWKGQAGGTWGIDQFIGPPDYLGKGYGTKLVREFTNALLEESHINKVICDPDPKNEIAISCYLKAGFSNSGIIETPDGEATLMEKFEKTYEAR